MPGVLHRPRLGRLGRALSRHGARLPRRTVRLRLTLIYGGLFLLTGVALLGITYFLVKHDIGNNFVATTKNGATAIITRNPGVPIGVATISNGSGQRIPETSNSATVERSGIVRGSGGATSAVRSGGIAVRVPVPGVINGKPPTAKQAQEQLDILLSQARAEQNAELHQLLLDSGIALLVMVVISVLLGWLVAGRVLRPLRVVTSKAQAISSRNLHERIGLLGPEDEMKSLGDTFDALLERLERSFDTQRQFVANASHELRTPLARQRALLEVASADPQADSQSLRDASARAVEAIEEQERLIDALLTLASSERGLEERRPFDLATIVRSVVEPRAPEAALRGMRIDTHLASAPTSGNERLARRLVANLVDNALSYNIEDGWVSLSTVRNGGEAVLRVSNSGPAIPDADVERLFKPFERMTRDRTAREGHGLGLAIVKAVIEAHDGTVTAVASPEGGLDVEVRFPGASSTEAPSSNRSDHALRRRRSSTPRH